MISIELCYNYRFRHTEWLKTSITSLEFFPAASIAAKIMKPILMCVLYLQVTFIFIVLRVGH
jgi:hypothetical protein